MDDSTADNADVIMDFQLGTDRIHLSALDAVAGTAVSDAFSFVGTAAFSGKAGELRYSVQDGMTIVQADTNGNKQTDFELHLAGALQLTPDAFILG
jgi:serralysin